MVFIRKNLQAKRRNMTFIKGATLFFLGMSAVLFMAQAFDIGVVVPNTIQYIQKVFLTADGSNVGTTGIILDGTPAGGITITNLTGKVLLGTDSSGKIISSTYISTYTETDPIWSAASGNYVRQTQTGNWNTAFGRGNHASAGYLTASALTPYYLASNPSGYITTETDPKIGTLVAGQRCYENGGKVVCDQTPPGGAGAETDPVWSAASGNYVRQTQTGNWNTAYGRGNHATFGYLTTYTETDPKIGTLVAGQRCYATGSQVVCNQTPPGGVGAETDPIWSAASGNYVRQTQTGNWNTAFGRGNHASAGYLTTYTETDPKIGTLAAGRRCYATGGKVVCDQTSPSGVWVPGTTANTIHYDVGNVGIGTDTPAAKLSVVDGGTINTIPGIKNSYINIAAPNGILSATPKGIELGYINSGTLEGGYLWSKSGSGMLFSTDQADTYLSRVDMSIDNAGNVGIGQISAGAKLHVIGEGKFTDSVQIGTPERSRCITTGDVGKIIVASYCSATSTRSTVFLGCARTGSLATPISLGTGGTRTDASCLGGGGIPIDGGTPDTPSG